jgi:glycosyltransferase involved in cell wall biosynthesis
MYAGDLRRCPTGDTVEAGVNADTGAQNLTTGESASATPRVTVSMTVFNGARFLRQAIASILTQTLHDLELIIVDDGSTDASAAIIADAARADRRIRFLRLEHGGIASASNQALAAARGAYFAPMDQDDIALPERLKRQAAFLDAHAEIAVVGAGARAVDEHGHPTPDAHVHPISADARRDMHRRCAILHPASMMRTSVVRALGGYRPLLPYAHDYDLFLRIGEGHSIANLPETLLHKRYHPGQVTRARAARPMQIVAGALAYMSHLGRSEDGTDIFRATETPVESGARFIDAYLARNPSPRADVVHHFSRFMRYAPITFAAPRNLAHPYLTYLRAASQAGGVREFVRTGYYLASFQLSDKAGYSRLSPKGASLYVAA